MKKATLILVMLIGFATIAQEHDGQKEHERKGPAGLKMKMPQFSPEQMATLHTKKMVLALDLDKSQQNQLQKFYLKNSNVRKEQLENRMKQRNSGEKKRLTADQKFDRANKKLDRAIANKVELKRILGEEKFKKHQAMQAKRKGKRKMTANKKQRGMKKKKMAMRKRR